MSTLNYAIYFLFDSRSALSFIMLGMGGKVNSCHLGPTFAAMYR